MFVDKIANLTVTTVYSANRLRNSPVGTITKRYHREGWAIALKTEGTTYYTVNGKRILSDALHPVILPKGCSYTWECEAPGECIIIEFDADCLETDFISFDIRSNRLILRNFLKMEKTIHGNAPNRKAECFQLLYEILAFLVAEQTRARKQPTHANRLAPAIAYISENYFDADITNEFLADLCGVSTVYFRKSFAAEYGISPIKYLHNFRIGKAKNLLCSDYESIEQVAFSVGYNSIYHFSKMFKKHTGKTPSEYAKASR